MSLRLTSIKFEYSLTVRLQRSVLNYLHKSEKK